MSRLGERVSHRRLPSLVRLCLPGLAPQPGSTGRAWLLRIKAQLLARRGEVGEARRLLQEALEAARSIPDDMGRDMNIRVIEKEVKAAETAPK